MNPAEFLAGKVRLHAGDSRELVKALQPGTIDAVVTDPPYALVSIVKRFGKKGAAPAKGNEAYARASAGFMGKAWDTGEVAFDPAFWADVLAAMKPGAHLVAFCGTRSYHRLACAIEDAGFEIRDQLAWVYGSGFPKSHDAERAIAITTCNQEGRHFARSLPKPSERKEGDHVCLVTPESEPWQGWGTALKPAWEPIVLARRPLARDAGGTVAGNVLAHGTGALNIDGCRVGDDGGSVTMKGDRPTTTIHAYGNGLGAQGGTIDRPDGLGRWPANIVHDGSDEVVDCFPGDAGGGNGQARIAFGIGGNGAYSGGGQGAMVATYADSSSAARFFYTAKADAEDRIGSKHPTVKPLDLKQWLVRLVCPKGGTVLDPFAGTGTTGEAAWREGCRAVLFEREDDYLADIARRMELALAPPRVRQAEIARRGGKRPGNGASIEDHGLFGAEALPAAPEQGGRRVYGTFARDRAQDRADRIEEIGED